MAKGVCDEYSCGLIFATLPFCYARRKWAPNENFLVRCSDLPVLALSVVLFRYIYIISTHRLYVFDLRSIFFQLKLEILDV